MDSYEIEPYRFAGEYTGKCAIRIIRLSNSGTDEMPFNGGPTFDNEQDALRYGVKWVASRGGLVRRTVLQRLVSGD